MRPARRVVWRQKPGDNHGAGEAGQSENFLPDRKGQIAQVGRDAGLGVRFTTPLQKIMGMGGYRIRAAVLLGCRRVNFRKGHDRNFPGSDWPGIAHIPHFSGGIFNLRSGQQRRFSGDGPHFLQHNGRGLAGGEAVEVGGRAVGHGHRITFLKDFMIQANPGRGGRAFRVGQFRVAFRQGNDVGGQQRGVEPGIIVAHMAFKADT